ncbi:ankyrin repeat-containing domain protein [Mycena galericulata]|nr:ankyrin repeat-containing domain protein [Mycena galericulata]
MSLDYFAELPPELICLLPPSLSTASLNALTLTCRHLYSILQPELEARITPELGRELLLWAAASRPAIVAKLLSLPLSIHPNDGYERMQTPLHVATDAGNTATAALLLDAGADCAAAAQWGHEDCQPFHLAVCNKDYAMMELLLDRGAPLDDTFGADNVHENALHFACYDIRDPELVRFLLARGADTECRGHHGTALGFAMKARDVDVVKILLEHGAKAEVSVPLNGGWLAGGPPAPYKATLLYCALGLAHPRSRYSAGPASEGRRELMAMLLLHGASKEGAMKTVYEYLPKLAEAADKSEKELLKFVKRIFNDAKSAIPEVSRQFDRHRNPWYRLKDQVFRAKS